MEPGIYDISNEDYHNSEGISRSGLVLFKKSPKHFWHQYLNPLINKDEDETNAKTFGHALHLKILEPLLFENEFCISPKFDRRTNIGKELFRQWEADNTNKKIITTENYEKILEMSESIKNDKYANQLIIKSDIEKSIYWIDEDTGILCKARPDIIKNNIICDLKTTEDACDQSFMHSAYKYNYHIQAAMIKDGFEKVTNEKITQIVIIAVEKNPPYAVKNYIFDETAIEKGRQEYKELLIKYKNSLINNKWDGYEPSYLFLPKYAYY